MDIKHEYSLTSEFQPNNIGTDLVDDLDKCDREIARLQLQLAKYRVCRNNLKSKSRHLQRSFCSIQLLPDELLIVIFEHHLWWDHIRISDLLVVSRRWYNIILHSPSIWARIQIKPQFLRTEGFDWAAYVEVCVSRSMNTPLHVCLDLRYFWPRDGFFSQIITDTVQGYVDHKTRSETIQKLNYMPLQLPSTRYDKFYDRILVAIGDAVGDKGRHMRRWKSLFIRFPSGSSFLTEKLTWLKLAGNADAVESLTVVNMAGVGNSLLDFPNAQYLTLTRSEDAHPDIDGFGFLQIDQLSLRHLDYRMNWDSLDHLSKFNRLETLVLHHPDLGRTVSCSKSSSDLCVHLPLLHTLILLGTLDLILSLTFHLPSLNCLHIIKYVPPQQKTNILPSQIILPSFPRVYPRYVTWTVGSRFRGSWDTIAIKAALEEVIQQYDEAEIIVVTEFARGAAEELIAELTCRRLGARVVFSSDAEENDLQRFTREI